MQIHLADPLAKLLNEIEAGRVEDANRTIQLLDSWFRDPAHCTPETLAALERARTLALIQRSQIQRRLRTVAASRLYAIPTGLHFNTWRLEG
jgi:hypothetical protein